MADDLMESLETYNISDSGSIQTAYLSGYLANRYDLSDNEVVDRANRRIKISTEKAFQDTVTGFNTVTVESSGIRLFNNKAKYALYPVWILNTDWNGQKYTFAMNGQTGKFVGNLPLDKGAFVKWLIGLTGLFGAISFAVMYLTWFL